MRQIAILFGGFSVSVIINAVSSLLLIPLVISEAGAGTWTTISVSQSLGALFLVVISFGWGVTGPALVAGTPLEDRKQLFASSVGVRLLLFSAVTPIALFALSNIPLGNHSVSIIAMLTVLISSLGASWYFVGESSPKRLLLYDTLPRMVGNILGAFALILKQDVALFLMFQLAATTVSVGTASASVWLRLRHYRSLSRGSFNALGKALKSQLSGVVTSSTASLYVNAPLVLVAMIAPGTAPAFAVADRMLKFSLTALAPATQVAQGAIPHSSIQEMIRRIRTAVRAMLILSLLAGMAFAIALPLAGTILSRGSIHLTFGLSSAFGLAFFAILFSGVVGLACLASLGQMKAVATSTVLGALAGVPLVVGLATVWGATGAAWGMAASEAIVASYQVYVLRKTILRL